MAHGASSKIRRLKFTMGISGALIAHLFLKTCFGESIPEPTRDSLMRGLEIYQKQCVTCHGQNGDGKGPAAYLLYPKPRDFTLSKFHLVSTKNMQVTNEDIYKTLTRGMPGSSMPAWDHLPDLERWSLVHYVRFLAERASYIQEGKIEEKDDIQNISDAMIKEMLTKQAASDQIIQMSPEPPVTEKSLAQGREYFVEACASCHGKEGKGDATQLMMDNSGFPIKPRNLTTGVFMRDASSKELYDRTIGGIPGTPMPSYNEVFTEEQLWDLIHYMQSLVPPNTENRARLFTSDVRSTQTVDDISQNPLDEQWLSIASTVISLAPLWRTADQIDAVEVRVLYNQKQIGVRLTWKDPTQDELLTTPQSFFDAVAVQISTENDPPVFSMGSKESPVILWQWKAAWEKDLTGWQDIETQYPNIGVDGYKADTTYHAGDPFDAAQSKLKNHDSLYYPGWHSGNPVSNPQRTTSGEISHANGFSTLTSEGQSLSAKGVWKDGSWHVTFIQELNSKNEKLTPGKTLNMAFAVWDGSRSDRNGQKVVSVWNKIIWEATHAVQKTKPR